MDKGMAATILFGAAVVLYIKFHDKFDGNEYDPRGFKKSKTGAYGAATWIRWICSILCSYVAFSSLVLFDMLLRCNDFKRLVLCIGKPKACSRCNGVNNLLLVRLDKGRWGGISFQ